MNYSLMVGTLVDANEDFNDFVYGCIKEQAATGQLTGTHKVPERFWTKDDPGADGSDGKGNFFTEIIIRFVIDGENAQCYVNYSEEVL